MSDDYSSSTDLSDDSDEFSISDNGNQFTNDVIKNKYLLFKKLDCGAFSSVWIAYNIEDASLYALKISNADDYEDCLKEVTILKNLNKYNHKNILYLIEYFIIEKNQNNHIIMVLKLYDSNLKDLLKIKKFSFQDSIKIMRQILEAIYIMHNKMEYIHTDLKPENILVTCRNTELENIKNYFKSCNFPELYKSFKHKFKKLNKKDILKRLNKHLINGYKKIEDNYIEYDPNNFNLVLADFGNCKRLNDATNETIQTRYYRAPEVIFNLKYSRSCDIWSLGCLFYEIISQNKLFDPEKDKNFNTDQNHLMMIYDLLGKPPQIWLNKCLYYKLKDNELFDNVTPKSFEDLFKEDGVLDDNLIHNASKILRQILTYTDRPKIKNVIEIFKKIQI